MKEVIWISGNKNELVSSEDHLKFAQLKEKELNGELIKLGSDNYIIIGENSIFSQQKLKIAHEKQKI